MTIKTKVFNHLGTLEFDRFVNDIGYQKIRRIMVINDVIDGTRQYSFLVFYEIKED